MNEFWTSNAYAKINLGLHIKDRLENGYHDLETGFCFIEWADRIMMRPASVRKLIIEDSVLEADENNLILKAYDLLRKEVEFDSEYEIRLEKNIPMGAGLGGGSSDAATTLRMLNKIEDLGLTDEDLAKYGKALGADVPVFIHGKTAIGSGTGVDLEFIDIQPDAWILTVYPNFESPTAEAYQNFNLDFRTEYNLKNILLNDDIDDWPNFLQNDLETSVFMRHELVGNMKDQMYEFGAAYAAMSGSGSSVYGLFSQDFVAIHAYESFTSLGFRSNLSRPNFQPDFGIYIKEIDE